MICHARAAARVRAPFPKGPLPMRRVLSLFLRGERGAVTVDWVVLTAATMGIIFAILGLLWDSLTTNVGFLNNAIDNRTISTTFE